jgi:hypothetical protein
MQTVWLTTSTPDTDYPDFALSRALHDKKDGSSTYEFFLIGQICPK